jgi:protein-serine/threonine kinase
MPSHFDEHSRDIIYKLLTVDEDKRLGRNGVQEIINHSWFAQIDWSIVQNPTGPLYDRTRVLKNTAYMDFLKNFFE